MKEEQQQPPGMLALNLPSQNSRKRRKPYAVCMMSAHPIEDTYSIITLVSNLPASLIFSNSMRQAS
jgi:hypothetical protein